MHPDDIVHRLPDGGTARTIGDIVITTRDGTCAAYCRRCGSELARWRAGERPERLRCSCR